MMDKRFFNRELSWIEFNQRVLEEARDPSVPLLERLFFLTISASNLDEFTMVRMGGLSLMREAGIKRADPSGMRPDEQMDRIRSRMRRFLADQYACLRDLAGSLAGEGMILREGAIAPEVRETMADLFENEIFAAVTPVAVQPGHAFPLLHSGDVYLACRLAPLSAKSPWPGTSLVLIRLDAALPQLILLPGATGGSEEYVWLEDLVASFAGRLLPGRRILETACLRVTRNAGLEVNEEYEADLAEAMGKILRRRRVSSCVRLEVSSGASATLVGRLGRALSISQDDTFPIPGPLDLTRLEYFRRHVERPRLCYPAWTPQAPLMIEPAEDLFQQIAERDVLLRLPYESFDPVIGLLEAAARDDGVLAIKIVLYRTAANSAVVRALRAAVGNGKSVTAVMEIKARFDEAANIAWARDLESAGAQVIYGIKNLKTHAKTMLIVRRESSGIVRYVHLATGNYNEKTARLYTDVGLLTADPVIAADVSSFFHSITGCSQPQSMRMLAQAPLNLRERLLQRIQDETKQAAAGHKASITAKINNLVDPVLIEALYQAAAAGVAIRLCVRGICCLRPGLPETGGKIRVISIIDRFLEHCRVLCFHNSGNPLVYISSADWMPRNLDRRVELMVPVLDHACREVLVSMLDTVFADNVKARELLPDGSYRKVQPAPGEKRRRSQERLCRQACRAAERARRTLRTVFDPHVPESQSSGSYERID